MSMFSSPDMKYLCQLFALTHGSTEKIMDRQPENIYEMNIIL